MPNETSPLLENERPSPTSTENGANDRVVDGELVDRPKLSTRSFAVVIVPMAVGTFLVAMDGTIIASSYASIGSEMKQLQNTSWLATAYLLTLTSFQPLYGKMSDIFGRKACLLFAYSIFALGSLFCGLSRTMTELIASRAFAGIGGGGMTTIVTIILSDLVPLRLRGTMQGVLNIIFAFGSASGAPLGGFLADTIGWRWAFLVQVPMAIFAIISVAFALRLPETEASHLKAKLKRVDFSGAVALVLTVFFLLFALDRGGNVSWSDKLTILSTVAFVVLFVIFAFIEMKFAREPFAPKRIIVNRSLIACYLVNFFHMAFMMSVIFYISLYFQAVQGTTASEAGLWLIPYVLGGVFGSLTWGLIMQSTGKYYIATVVACLAAFFGASFILLSTGIISSSPIYIAISLFVASVGVAASVTTGLVALIANAGQADQAISTAVSYLFRSLGSVVGVSIGSTLMQAKLRSSLSLKLSGDDVDKIIQHVRESLNYINELDPTIRAIVRGSYEQAIHVTLAFAAFMTFCAVVASIFIKEKPLGK